MKRKGKLNKVSPREVPKLKRKLWVLFSLYIRERDKYKCFTCGKFATGQWMHAGHFITRKNNSTLFDPINVHAQCASCNLYLQGNVAVYAQNIIKVYGKEKFDNLVKRGREIKQWDARQLKLLIEVLVDGKGYPQQYERIYKMK